MAVSIFFTALMPISHAAAWWMVLQTKNTEDAAEFYKTVASIAAFYCAWALYKVFGMGDKKEKGQFSMGLLAASAVFLQNFPYVVMAANVLVILNFAVVVPFFVNRGVAGIAKMVHKEVTTLTMTWGYVFLFYLLGNVALWSFVLRTLWDMNAKS